MIGIDREQSSFLKIRLCCSEVFEGVYVKEIGRWIVVMDRMIGNIRTS